MAGITRWEPFREINRMQDLLDQMMDRAILESPGRGAGASLPLDVVQTDDAVVIKASAPGIKAADLSVSISGDTVSIKGEMKADQEHEDGVYFLRERRVGSLSRTITLPTLVDSDKAEANFKDGILTLTLPKSEQVKPKEISIKAV
ncbi:MAG: Hsp20/alpha crystallin family protein [Anaerolineales bacterium]|nr:Hsp20/alpha crystallin family protein [Anaerolineales bacterium]